MTAYIFKDEAGTIKTYDVADSEKITNFENLFIRLENSVKIKKKPFLFTIMIVVAFLGVFIKFFGVSGEMLHTLKTKHLLVIGACVTGGLIFIIKEYFRKKR